MRSKILACVSLGCCLALGACSSGSPDNNGFGKSGGSMGTGTGGSLATGGGTGTGTGGGTTTGTGGATTGTGGAATGTGGTTTGTGGTTTGTGGTTTGTGGAGTGTGGAATGTGGTATGTGGRGGTAVGGAIGSTGGAGGATEPMSAGCGKATTTTPAAFARVPFTVTGQPAASASRFYSIRLPTNYSPTRAYRVIYIGVGCGALPAGRGLFPFETDAGTVAARTDAILVQMEPGTYNPAQYNPTDCRGGGVTTGCNANSAYCFDDWAYVAATMLPDNPRGSAIERAYFDQLHKTIETNYCVDTSRQFFAGYSSGGWLAQQLGCWFPDVLRAQANVTGGIPPNIQTNVFGSSMSTTVTGPNDYCVKKPLSAFLLHDYNDTSNTFPGSVSAARRLFNLNGCTGTFNQPPQPNSTAALPAGLAAYSITGVPNSNVFRCFQYTTCPAETPMVFCVSSDGQHNNQNARATPGFWEFFTKL